MCSFTAEVDGRTIQGVVKETEEAQTDYDEAIRSGHTAFLVEEKLPDVFKVGEMNVVYLNSNKILNFAGQSGKSCGRIGS